MKALTFSQPWASLVALGGKPVETRPWATAYRGPLLIHAAGKTPRELQAILERLAPLLDQAAGPPLPAAGDLPFGAVIAVARLVDCWLVAADPGPGREPFTPLDRHLGDLTPGRYAWRLADVRPLREPIEWKRGMHGGRGLWDVPPDLELRVAEGLHAAGPG